MGGGYGGRTGEKGMIERRGVGGMVGVGGMLPIVFRYSSSYLAVSGRGDDNFLWRVTLTDADTYICIYSHVCL